MRKRSRFSFIRRKKVLALVMALIIVVALVYAINKFRFRDTGPNFEAEEKVLLGGQVNTITIKGDVDHGTVHLPWGFIALENGTYTWDKNLTFEGNTFTFEALVSPYLYETSVNVSSGGQNDTIHFKVEPGPAPLVSGEGWLDYLRTLTGTYPHRQTGIPGHYAAADWIKDQFDGFGYEAEINHYRWSDRLNPNPIIDKPVSEILTITGIKWGQKKDEWIVVGAHFDNAVGNRMQGEGAYDNGSGTTLMLELARAMKEIETRYTIVFGAWGGEEEGLIGSQRFVEDLPPDVDVKFNLNLDMIGLGFPNDKPLYIECGPNATEEIDHTELWEIMENVTIEGMNISKNESLVILEESRGGGSDHTSFQRVDVPTVFMIADYDYPGYHSTDDTLSYMTQYVGGEDNLLMSFDLDAWIAFFILLNVEGNDGIHQGEVPW